MTKVKCGRCFGTGTTDCDMEYGEDNHPSNCPACGGTNKVICSDCDGNELVDKD